MRIAIMFAALLALVGCGSGGGGGSYGGGGGSTPPAPTLPNNGYPVVTISGTFNSDPAVSYAGTFNFQATGTSNTAGIVNGSALGAVLIHGTYLDITVGTGSTVSGTIEVYGTNNTIHLPASGGITINDHGTGTSIILFSSG